MAKRKLVKQGRFTMMISLPSKWIKENSLEKGDEINLVEKGNSLIIGLEEEKEKKTTQINFSSLTESSIRTLITNAYRRGTDKITVNFNDEKQFIILQEVINSRLIGFEIIKKQGNSCIVENITEPSSDQFDNLLKKMFMNIGDLFDITKTRFEGKKPEEDYNQVEQRIQKYDNFCRRVISKKRLFSNKSELFWTFLTLIIHGQREIYHLNKIINNKTKPGNKEKELLEKSSVMFNLLLEAYEKKDLEILSKMHELEKDLVYKKGYSMLKEKKENIIAYHLIASVRGFYQANSPLSGLILTEAP
jgi:phosphate uptake regulator